MYNISPYAQARGSYVEPINDPGVDPDVGPFVLLSVSAAWLPIVLGCLSQLYQRTTWNYATEADLLLAIDRSRLLTNQIGAPILTVPGVTPIDAPLTRYDAMSGQVQTSIDGGTTWTDTPASNPQNQTYLAPQSGTDARCNSAASGVKYLERWNSLLQSVIPLGIGGVGLAYGLIGLLQDLTGPWAILLSVAEAAGLGLISYGVTAIGAAFVSTNLDILTCILYCDMNSSFQFGPIEFAIVQSDVSDQIGGTSALILSAILTLMGYGGLNDAMALKLATGVCTGCFCCDDYGDDFAAGFGPLTTSPAGNDLMTWSATGGHSNPGCAHGTILFSGAINGQIDIDLGRECTVLNTWWWRKTAVNGTALSTLRYFDSSHTAVHTPSNVGLTSPTTTWQQSQDNALVSHVRYITLFVQGSPTSAGVFIDDITIGVSP